MGILLVLVVGSTHAQPGQLTIQRVEAMPSMPTPYQYQDWSQIAIGYDQFVFDRNKSGEHLPLIFTFEQGINYPERPSFGLDTYVGTVNDRNGEAINILPALVGATLVGIDKSDQNGVNWILQSQDYFNKKNGQNIYLNNRGAQSGNDWWYDMMPNVYFYQLYELYGSIGDADFQFTAIADQFAEAVRSMGGSDTPWMRASMNYRAWDFKNDIPNEVGVPEPEAAGAFAWVLYHAYKRTQNEEYRKAAEWSMEYLSNLGSNPSYELQLPYGTYTAAKMNAELATNYDVEKLMFWVFNRGPLRGWGTVVDKWGGVDVSGLVGEANETGNDYVFMLNGLQQAAALVPMTRYDKRYSRTVARWMLNLTNATRYLFPNALPASQQDSEDWADQYDPNNYIGYEALREVKDGFSPYATGDAIAGGWAATNLSLYSTSSIGYLGSIVQETDVEKILQLDLLKTDFYRDAAYPSFLFYNPYASAQSITVDVGATPVDIYDSISETFLHQNVTGTVQIDIPADEVVSLVYTPVNGTLRYENNKLYIDDVIVDYRQSQQLPYEFAPRIQSLAAQDTLLELGDTTTVYAKATDVETKTLTYTWSTAGGTLLGEGTELQWIAPQTSGASTITLIVSDADDNRDTAYLTIRATEEVNLPPIIESLVPAATYAAPGATIAIQALASDGNGDPLDFTWTADAGEISGQEDNITWTAPMTEGIYRIILQVTDNKAAAVQASIEILVRDFTQAAQSNLIAHYPFSGNANDISGNELHGDVFGAKLTSDGQGMPQEAYFFDGNNDHISVPNEPVLNFTDGVNVAMWFSARPNNTGEVFLLSHGSWQNRYKISLTPEKRVRWTVHNANGNIIDMDSKTIIEPDVFYHVSAGYDGAYITLYINGRLESFRPFSGKIRQSPVGLEIAQMLPDNQEFNFSGILDDIQIHDNALIPEQVKDMVGEVTSVGEVTANQLSLAVFPNPAQQWLRVDWSVENNRAVHGGRPTYLMIYSMDGKAFSPSVISLSPSSWQVDVSQLPPGAYWLQLNIEDRRGYQKFIKSGK